MNKFVDEEDRLYEERCKAYQDFFGDNWEDFEDHVLTIDKSPQEALDTLGSEIDYCLHCNHYFWADKGDWGIYYCPYCGQIGENSNPDEWNDCLARMEHEWEVRNER